MDCAPPTPKATNCGSTQIKCGNTPPGSTGSICIERYSLCDTIDDCGNGWDESADNCFKSRVNKCTFESVSPSARCNYTIESDHGSSLWWKTKSAYTASSTENLVRMTGPITDHTFGSNRR